MDFFIKQKRERPDELAKLLALLETTANHGTPKNKQKCRLLEDKIYEFKTTGGLRLLFFLDKGQLIVATHGYIKQKQKMPPGELKRAKRIREEYLEAKEQDRIETERSD
jgi:phage-related protein